VIARIRYIQYCSYSRKPGKSKEIRRKKVDAAVTGNHTTIVPKIPMPDSKSILGLLLMGRMH